MLRRLASVCGAVMLSLLLARSAAADMVTATPADGNQFETFTCIGSGFTPSDQVSVSLISPDDEEFRLYDADDEEIVPLVQADGGFSLSLRPVDDRVGSVSGRWTARFCPTRSLYCQQVAFAIRL